MGRFLDLRARDGTLDPAYAYIIAAAMTWPGDGPADRQARARFVVKIRRSWASADTAARDRALAGLARHMRGARVAASVPLRMIEMEEHATEHRFRPSIERALAVARLVERQDAGLGNDELKPLGDQSGGLYGDDFKAIRAALADRPYKESAIRRELRRLAPVTHLWAAIEIIEQDGRDDADPFKSDAPGTLGRFIGIAHAIADRLTAPRVGRAPLIAPSIVRRVILPEGIAEPTAVESTRLWPAAWRETARRA